MSSAPVVYVHIGAPKTGTTYLQDRLTLNRRRLAREGVQVPTRNMWTPPAMAHFRAALDLLGQDWGGHPGHAQGWWPPMAREMRKSSGTVVFSHEILAPAPPAKIARLMNDLEGCEVHVVYSARDLARQLPAAWQESVKQGRGWRFQRFLNAAEEGNPWFMRAFDLPTVLNNWSRNLPPERVHVVTVPPAGADPDELWLRFCRVFGIDPAWAPLDSERANASLGIAETELLRRLNRKIDRRTRRSAAHDDLLRRMLDSRRAGRPHVAEGGAAAGAVPVHRAAGRAVDRLDQGLRCRRRRRRRGPAAGAGRPRRRLAQPRHRVAQGAGPGRRRRPGRDDP